jgi:hypothetical protein
MAKKNSRVFNKVTISIVKRCGAYIVSSFFADPGCLSRILIFFIPDPESWISDRGKI